MIGKLTRSALFMAGTLALQSGAITFSGGAYHVHPNDNIQDAIEQAGQSASNKTVIVHPGTYRPQRPGQALVWFNRKHDGVRLIAEGDVTLTAANEKLADPKSKSLPAVVNHVVYFGDGVSEKTLLHGFRITGAKDYFSTNGAEQVEPDKTLVKGLFFYGDGGGIKIFGRSYPQIDRVELVDNYASPCAGGISVEHDGHGDGPSPRPVVIRNSIFRSNTAEVNGAALDLLIGSFAVVSNCLFVGNAGNLGPNYIMNRARPEFTNAAVVCVFPNARLIAKNCTFIGNRNGIHDQGVNSVYQDCIFHENTLAGGHYTNERYEAWIENTARIGGCFISGRVLDPNAVINSRENRLRAGDPQFDAEYAPQAAAYRPAGYRPVKSLKRTAAAEPAYLGR